MSDELDQVALAKPPSIDDRLEADRDLARRAEKIAWGALDKLCAEHGMTLEYVRNRVADYAAMEGKPLRDLVFAYPGHFGSPDIHSRERVISIVALAMCHKRRPDRAFSAVLRAFDHGWPEKGRTGWRKMLMAELEAA